MEAPFSLQDIGGQIGSSIGAFFSSLEDLALDPSSLPLRMQVIEEGNRLTGSINETFDHLAGLQREADTRLETKVEELNKLTEDIAGLNSQILSTEIGEQQNLALRDRRESFIKELSELVKVKCVEDERGSVALSLENGFTLVNGSSKRDLTFTNTPTFAEPNGLPPGLDGASLGSIVYETQAASGNSQFDLTKVLRSSSGEIGGLLCARGVQHLSDTSTFHCDGDLVTVATRVEAMARDLLVNFNRAYLGADEDSTVAGLQSSAGDMRGSSPSFDGLFSFEGLADEDGNGLVESGDLETYSDLNGGFGSFAKVLNFKVSDPLSIAASRDLDSTEGVKSFGEGDSRNIDALIALRNEEREFTIPDLNPSLQTKCTIEELYNSTVSLAGTLSYNAQRELEISTDQETQVEEFHSSLSAVSLDEELAQLLSFQKAFEGSAKLVKISDDLLSQIIQLAG